MQPESLHTERQKPGPKAKPKVDVEALQVELEAIKALLIEVATHTGQAGVVRKHGFPAFQYVAKNKY